MAILTAQQYRARRSPREFVRLASGDQAEVRSVDAYSLAMAKTLDADEIDRVIALLKDQDENQKLAVMRAQSDRVAVFIDAIVVAGTVSPRIVATRQDSDSDVLGIDELDLADKLLLLAGITRATVKKTDLVKAQTAEAAELTTA